MMLNLWKLGSLLCFSIFVLISYQCNAYNILLLPMPSKSHFLAMLAIGKALKENGNKVYILVEKSILDEETTLKFGVDMLTYGLVGGNKDKEDLSKKMLEDSIANSKADNADFAETRKSHEKALLWNKELFHKLNALDLHLAVVDASFFIKHYVLVPHRLRIPYVLYSDTLDAGWVGTPWLPAVNQPKQLMLYQHWLERLQSFKDILHELSSYFLSERSFYNASGVASTGKESISLVTSPNFVDRVFNFLVVLYFKLFPVFSDCSERTMKEYRKYGHYRNLDDLISRLVNAKEINLFFRFSF